MTKFMCNTIWILTFGTLALLFGCQDSDSSDELSDDSVHNDSDTFFKDSDSVVFVALCEECDFSEDLVECEDGLRCMRWYALSNEPGVCLPATETRLDNIQASAPMPPCVTPGAVLNIDDWCPAMCKCFCDGEWRCQSALCE